MGVGSLRSFGGSSCPFLRSLPLLRGFLLFGQLLRLELQLLLDRRLDLLLVPAFHLLAESGKVVHLLDFHLAHVLQVLVVFLSVRNHDLNYKKVHDKI